MERKEFTPAEAYDLVKGFALRSPYSKWALPAMTPEARANLAAVCGYLLGSDKDNAMITASRLVEKMEYLRTYGGERNVEMIDMDRHCQEEIDDAPRYRVDVPSFRVLVSCAGEIGSFGVRWFRHEPDESALPRRWAAPDTYPVDVWDSLPRDTRGPAILRTVRREDGTYARLYPTYRECMSGMMVARGLLTEPTAEWSIHT
jgi:hypothetical protein